jgi:mannose-6-phosphate isomerase-like protein (cupin superfamily)
VKFAELVKIMVEAEMRKLMPVPVAAAIHSDDRRDLRTFPEAKLITVKRDCVLGAHYHAKKTEMFMLSEGIGTIVTEAQATPMEIGRIYTVLPGVLHTFRLTAGSVLVGLNSTVYDPSDDYKVEAAK